MIFVREKNISVKYSKYEDIMGIQKIYQLLRSYVFLQGIAHKKNKGTSGKFTTRRANCDQVIQVF